VLTVALSLHIHFQAEGDPVQSMVTASKSARLKLLLSLCMMATLGYPLPSDVFHTSDQESVRVVPTKCLYRKLGPDSPIFVLDCEMVVTESGCYELARVSMVGGAGVAGVVVC
jgi:hypothetical protein